MSTQGLNRDELIRALQMLDKPAADEVLTWSSGLPVWAAAGSSFTLAEGAHVSHNANQTINNGSSAGAGPAGSNEHTISFNLEVFDTDGMHDTVTNNSRLTVVTAGVYLVGFYGRITGGSAAGKQIWSSIWHLNSSDAELSRSFSEDGLNAAGTWGPINIVFVDADATDYFEVGIRNEDSGSVTLTGNANYSPQFFCWRVGDAL